MEDMIHIAFGFDDNYAMPCGVAMLSICINTPWPICFHVMLDDDVTEESRKKIEGIAQSYGKQVIFYTPDTSKFSGLPEFIHVTKGTYLRFLLPDLLPSDMHKVLYLDVDIVAAGSLAPLWEMELGPDVPAAMAIDRFTTNRNVHASTAIPMSREYFNAGVMLMNLDCWRSERLGDVCLKEVYDHLYPYMDQDAMNVVFGERVRRLHLKYNAQMAFFTRPLDERGSNVERYQDEIREAEASPVIIHYSEAYKPWHSNYHWPEEWLKYKALSPWKDTKLSRREVNGKYTIYMDGVKRFDSEYVDSIVMPLLTVTSRFGQRHPRIFLLLRKALWTYVKRKNLIGDINNSD